MFKTILDNKLLFIIAHFFIGYAVTFDFFTKPFGLAIILIGLLTIIFSSNKNEEAFKASCYIVGIGVFMRMTGGFPTYESGKYIIIIYLLTGTFVGHFKQQFSLTFSFYLLLLTLGIVLTNVPEGESIKNAVVFNLSGPILLGVSALYFFRRPIKLSELYDGLFLMLLPLFSLVIYLYLKTPDLKEMIFNTSANFETSGGFGPNQVATALGVGIFIILVFILVKQKITGFIILDIFFLIYFIFRGLLTFSRGGVITALLAIITFSFFYILYNKGSIKIFLRYITLGLFAVFAVWMYTSNITKGMLDNRYAGKNAIGIDKEDITSGRVEILEEQATSFINNPVGIGVGNGKYKRELSDMNVTAASHNEMGRLLEEHGFIGLVILIILLVVPLENFRFANNYQRAFLGAFYLFWLLTINHSAMRIAFPGFIYALSLIRITDTDEAEEYD